MLLTAVPGAGCFGRLVPERENSETARRLLSCGVPETLPAALAEAKPNGIVTLGKLAAPEFSLG